MATLVNDVNSTTPAGKMAPSTLDLFMLTFNCAKNFINVAVFASHLHAAFKQNATGLPDLVVFSLQEVAPLSYSFIGGYFLGPYLARYEEALNIAATRYASGDDSNGSDDDTITVQPTAPSPVRPYTLVRARNVGMTGIVLFARNPEAILRVQEAEVGFGAAEMGNKGAVALRVLYEGEAAGGGKKETELTFVATHLAAMEWNLPRRNANWAAIMRSLTFENPEDILNPKKAPAQADAREDDDAAAGAGEERLRLLHDEHHAQNQALQDRLQDISVFKPSSHLFVGGDLNYRISTTSPPPGATFPSLDPDSEHHYARFFALDQLTRERRAGRTLHGMSEAEVAFPPTYKYDVLPPSVGGGRLEVDGAEDVPWVFAPHRYPGWTDRILYLEVPSWAQGGEGVKVDVKAYDAMPVVRSSDHRAVYLRAKVPLLTAEELAPTPGAGSGSDGSSIADPRLALPVAIDPEAWERRAAARRKEVLVGWSMILWSTKEGALVLATLLALGAGAWWLSQ